MASKKIKLPSETLDQLDHRYFHAKYGDSMIMMTRRLHRLSFPVALIISAATYYLISIFYEKVALPFSILLGWISLIWLQTRGCRVPWPYDFRQPILVLRSHQDERNKLGDQLPSDETLGNMGRFSYIHHLSLVTWDWCRCVILQNETDGFRGSMNAVVVEPKDNWESVVLDIAHEAWIILVFPSSTNGCLKEFNLLARNMDLLEKTVVFMPPSENATNGKIASLLRPPGGAQKVNHGKNWSNLQSELAVLGYRLPNYHEDGMLFIPTAAFSAKEFVSFHRNSYSWTDLLKTPQPWEGLLKLIPGPGISFGSLWNIVCYGNAYESGFPQRKGGVASDQFKPGSVVIHNPNGTITSIPATRDYEHGIHMIDLTGKYRKM